MALLACLALTAPLVAQDEPGFEAWVRDAAIRLDGWGDAEALSFLDEALEGKRVVFLGEPDHYIHEKYDYRLLFLRELVARGFVNVGMEVGQADARRVDAYLATGDEALLDRVPLLGYTGDARTDRDDRPRGLLEAASDGFYGGFIAEERWFLRELRALNAVRPEGAPRVRWFGFDVDVRAGCAYTELEEALAPHRAHPAVAATLERLARVEGETRRAEVKRLDTALDQWRARRGALEDLLGAARVDAVLRDSKVTLIAHARTRTEARTRPREPRYPRDLNGAIDMVDNMTYARNILILAAGAALTLACGDDGGREESDATTAGASASDTNAGSTTAGGNTDGGSGTSPSGSETNASSTSSTLAGAQRSRSST